MTAKPTPSATAPAGAEAQAPFDLQTTYVKLDGNDAAHPVVVDDQFWPTIDEHPDYQHGRLVMVFEFSEDWTTWEIHPAGPELVMVLSGAMDFILDLPTGRRTVPLQAGQTLLVPAGTWHTAQVPQACRAVFITPCEGTRNAALPE